MAQTYYYLDWRPIASIPIKNRISRNFLPSDISESIALVDSALRLDGIFLFSITYPSNIDHKDDRFRNKIKDVSSKIKNSYKHVHVFDKDDTRKSLTHNPIVLENPFSSEFIKRVQELDSSFNPSSLEDIASSDIAISLLHPFSKKIDINNERFALLLLKEHFSKRREYAIENMKASGRAEREMERPIFSKTFKMSIILTFLFFSICEFCFKLFGTQTIIIQLTAPLWQTLLMYSSIPATYLFESVLNLYNSYNKAINIPGIRYSQNGDLSKTTRYILIVLFLFTLWICFYFDILNTIEFPTTLRQTLIIFDCSILTAYLCSLVFNLNETTKRISVPVIRALSNGIGYLNCVNIATIVIANLYKSCAKKHIDKDKKLFFELTYTETADFSLDYAISSLETRLKAELRKLDEIRVFISTIIAASAVWATVVTIAISLWK